MLAALGLAAVSVALLVQDQGHPHAERALALLVLVVAAGLVLGRIFASAVLAGLRRVAILTRRLAGEWCGVPIADPYRAPGGRADPGLSRAEQLRWMLGDGATWRDLLWVTVNIVFGWILAAASAVAVGVGTVAFVVPALTKAVPPPAFPGSTKPVIAVLGLAIIATGVAAAPWLLRAYGLLASSMLAPAGNAELALRVRHLAQTRTEALDTGAAEIRRIERDLHDGAQARLVAMGMTLDAAGQLIDTNPGGGPGAADRGPRRLGQGPGRTARPGPRHPPAGAGRPRPGRRGPGPGAGQPDAHRPGQRRARPPAGPVESAAYFAVCELLANVSKHAGSHGRPGSTSGTPTGCCGSVSPTTGTAAPTRHCRQAAGCAGSSGGWPPSTACSPSAARPAARRTVTMEIPCALSLPKTSSC